MLKTIKIKGTWDDLCEMVQSECQINAKEMIRSKEIHDSCAVELKNGAHPMRQPKANLEQTTTCKTLKGRGTDRT